MKMASARKPESFVWTGNEVELLLQLKLNYRACKLQERLNIIKGWAMVSSFQKVCGFAVHMKTGGLRFRISPD